MDNMSKTKCIFCIKELIFIKFINSRYELYLEIALIVNNNMYNDNKIPYQVFKLTEEKLLEKIKALKFN